MSLEAARARYHQVMQDGTPEEVDQAVACMVSRGVLPGEQARALALIGDSRVLSVLQPELHEYQHPIQHFEELDRWMQQMIVEIGEELALRILLFTMMSFAAFDPHHAWNLGEIAVFAQLIQRGVFLSPLPDEYRHPRAEFAGREAQRQAYIRCVRRAVCGFIGRKTEQNNIIGQALHFDPSEQVVSMLKGRQGSSDGRSYLDERGGNAQFRLIKDFEYRLWAQEFYQALRDELLAWQWGVRDQVAQMAEWAGPNAFSKLRPEVQQWYRDWLLDDFPEAI